MYPGKITLEFASATGVLMLLPRTALYLVLPWEALQGVL